MGNTAAAQASTPWWPEEDPALDHIVVLTQGPRRILLIGESHADTEWDPMPLLRRLHQDAASLVVYVEQPLSGVCNESGNSPAAKVCRAEGAELAIRHIDPRPGGLYELTQLIREEAYAAIQRRERGTVDVEAGKRLYWLVHFIFVDFVALYCDFVLATVAQVSPRHDVTESMLDDLKNGVAMIHREIGRLQNSGDAGDVLEFFDGPALQALMYGLDAVFVAMAMASAAEVSVLFAGSAHTRRLAELLSERGGWGAEVLLDRE